MHRQTSWQHLVLVVGVALLVTVMSGRSHEVFAQPEGFVFTPLAFLGDPAQAACSSKTAARLPRRLRVKCHQ